MRLDSTISFPYQISLGAVQDLSLIYEMGEEIARQMKRSGLHVNFAPVVDINNNPENPVINYRSFGENKKEVSIRGIAYMKGLQDNGILATAKHFPGHGDTDSDSHYTLPLIKHNKEHLAVLIITTPEHMYRSIKTFKNVGFTKVGGLPTFEKPIDEEKLKETGETERIHLSFRYNMWSYLNYEFLVLKEYCAIIYYKLKGWI